MSFLLGLLGRDKLILEVVELVRDLLVEDDNNRSWTTIDEVLPPEKKMLVFRDKGGYYVGYCEHRENDIRVGKYGKFEIAVIPRKAYEYCYWKELGDPIGIYTDPDNFGSLPVKAEEETRS